MSKKGNKKSGSLKNKGSKEVKKEKIEKMKKEYIKLRAKGLSPCEIARKTGVSTSTVYRYLDEIATEYSVDRETLLMKRQVIMLMDQTKDLIDSTDEMLEKHKNDSQELYKRLATITAELEVARESIRKSRMKLNELDARSKAIAKKLDNGVEELDDLEKSLDEKTN